MAIPTIVRSIMTVTLGMTVWFTTTTSLLADPLPVVGLETRISQASPPASPGQPPSAYIFGWPFRSADELKLRGGTSQGPVVTLDTQPGEQWQKLQASSLSQFDRDRLAILAMAGPYRVSFNFLETIPFEPGYNIARPYFSWATEYAYVIEDRGNFISLQHIMAMTYVQEDGSISEPVIMKHWRQDWTYEDASQDVYLGRQRWQRLALKPAQRQGRWTQAVYQVDDSPRYEAIGQWEHRGNYSEWQSDPFWRPLPRREQTVRQDYEVMGGTHRIVITATGWVHEQTNEKLVWPADSPKPTKNLVEEAGLARYERIVGYDFSGADQYWRGTKDYWAQVRQVWNEILSSGQPIQVREDIDGQPLFAYHFEQAQQAFDGKAVSLAEVRALLKRATEQQ